MKCGVSTKTIPKLLNGILLNKNPQTQVTNQWNGQYHICIWLLLVCMSFAFNILNSLGKSSQIGTGRGIWDFPTQGSLYPQLSTTTTPLQSVWYYICIISHYEIFSCYLMQLHCCAPYVTHAVCVASFVCSFSISMPKSKT